MDSETIGCGCDSLESQCVFKSNSQNTKINRPGEMVQE